MRLVIYFMLVFHSFLGSSQGLQVKFAGDDDLEKFLFSQEIDSREYYKFFKHDDKYTTQWVYSITLMLTLNSEGSILKYDIVKPTTNKEYEDFMIQNIMRTSGKWKLPSSRLESNVKIIIPFVFSFLPTYTRWDNDRAGRKSRLNSLRSSEQFLELKGDYESAQNVVVMDLISTTVSEPHPIHLENRSKE